MLKFDQLPQRTVAGAVEHPTAGQGSGGTGEVMEDMGGMVQGAMQRGMAVGMSEVGGGGVVMV